MTNRQPSSQASGAGIGDAAHRVALGSLALTRAGIRRTATLVDGLLGGSLQTATGVLDAAGDTLRMVGRTLGSRAGDMIELRVTRVLNAFQIPTSRDVRELAQRVERLSQMVAAQDHRPAAKKTTAAAARKKTSTARPRRKSASKTAGKTAAKRKPSSRSQTNGSGRRGRVKDAS